MAAFIHPIRKLSASEEALLVRKLANTHSLAQGPQVYLAVVRAWVANDIATLIAKKHSISIGAIRRWIYDARVILGKKTIPHRIRGRRAGELGSIWPLDKITKPGDTIVFSKAKAGSRQSIYGMAKTRGWKISLRTAGNNWRIVALSKVPRPR